MTGDIVKVDQHTMSVIQGHEIGEIIQPLIRDIHLFDTWIAGTTHLEDKAALKATPEELTALTRMRMRRDSIRTQFETLGMKISYIRQKQKEQ